MNIEKLIDQTILRPEATRKEIETFCIDAKRYDFATVVVHPTHLSDTAKIFSDHPTRVGSVVDFCFGQGTKRMKALETEELVRIGADEIDTVINIGSLKSGDYRQVEEEIRAIVESGHQEWKSNKRDGQLVIKVIIEAGLLTDDEKSMACKIIKSAGADFVKTATGFLGGGATVKDVEIMRKAVGSDFGVKASGGIRTRQQLINMLEAGANRIGTSAGISIIEDSDEPPKDDY